jgi:hypothetical protein
VNLRRVGLFVAVGLPPLVLAAIGLTHPADLNAATAGHWRSMHILLAPIFPLLALGPWLVARRVDPRAGWVAAALGYVYAVFYGILDVLNGIGAGVLQLEADGAGLRPILDEGNALAEFGVWAYLLATILAAAAAFWRHRLRALPGAVLVVAAAVSFLRSHIYVPWGVLTMVVAAIGWLALAAATQPASRTADQIG